MFYSSLSLETIRNQAQCYGNILSDSHLCHLLQDVILIMISDVDLSYSFVHVTMCSNVF